MENLVAEGDGEEGELESAPPPPLRVRAAPAAASSTPLPSQLRRAVAPVDASASARVRISKRGSIEVQFPATPVTPVPGFVPPTAVGNGGGGAAAAHAHRRLGLSAEEIAAARADATRSATSAVARSPVVAEMRRVQAQMRSALGHDRSFGAASAASADPPRLPAAPASGPGLTSQLLGLKARFDRNEIDATELGILKSVLLREALAGVGPPPRPFAARRARPLRAGAAATTRVHISTRGSIDIR